MNSNTQYSSGDNSSSFLQNYCNIQDPLLHVVVEKNSHLPMVERLWNWKLRISAVNFRNHFKSLQVICLISETRI